MPFRDRADAGRQLGARLAHLEGEDLLVLGLPRGGVPVASAVADALGAGLDVILVRKLGVPTQPELAMGAIGEGGIRVLNEAVVRAAGVTEEAVAEVERRERAVLEERAARYRAVAPALPITGRTAVIVDDGIATGSTVRAACQVATAHGAGRVVVAVPVAPPGAVTDLRGDVSEIVCVDVPPRLWAVGQWYDDFSPVSDEEVVDLLARRRRA